MFKIGEKVVCINVGLLNEKSLVYLIKYGRIYTIASIDENNDVELLGLETIFYYSSRFISLSEFRRLKINKIINEKD